MKYLPKVLQDLSELCEPLSLISFAESHCTLTWQGGGNIKRRWREGQGRDNYSKEVINQGTAIIWGNTVLWNLRWALSIWWCNIQGPVMHHNADPEEKKNEQKLHDSHTGLQGCLCRAWETSILTRHECWNHWLHPEMRHLHVTSEWQTKEPLFCHKPTSTSWEKVATDIFTLDDKNYLCTVDYYSGYFKVDQLHSKTGTVIIKNLTGRR